MNCRTNNLIGGDFRRYDAHVTSPKCSAFFQRNAARQGLVLKHILYENVFASLISSCDPVYSTILHSLYHLSWADALQWHRTITFQLKPDKSAVWTVYLYDIRNNYRCHISVNRLFVCGWIYERQALHGNHLMRIHLHYIYMQEYNSYDKKHNSVYILI